MYPWDTMRVQLQDFLTDQRQFDRELGDSKWCLPAAWNANGGILETLVLKETRLPSKKLSR